MPRPRTTPRVIEQYIPLPAAIKKYHVTKKLLTDLVNNGRIKAVKSGATLLLEERKVKMFSKRSDGIVATADHPKLAALRKKYAHLRGNSIPLLEAARKYDVSDSILYRWAERGFITVINRGSFGLLLDESDVAVFCELRTLGAIRSGPGSMKSLQQWLNSPPLPNAV